MSAYFFLGQSLRCPKHSEVAARKSWYRSELFRYYFSSGQGCWLRFLSWGVLAPESKTMVRIARRMLPIYAPHLQYVLWVRFSQIFYSPNQLGDGRKTNYFWSTRSAPEVQNSVWFVIVVDQYGSESTQKWLSVCSITFLLPWDQIWSRLKFFSRDHLVHESHPNFIRSCYFLW